MKPKHVILSGGEPFLLSNIVDVMRTMRERLYPYIMITTNLMVDPDIVCRTLPYFDQLHFSIDGTGDYNRINRGVSGEVVLERLMPVMKAIQKLDREFPVTALCVVTKDNFENVVNLAESVHEIDPKIRISYANVEPIHCPISLLHNAEIMEKLFPELRALGKRHNISVVGPLGERMRAMESDGKSESQKAKSDRYYCTRQFFRVMMDPDGNTHLCKPGHYLSQGLSVAESYGKQHRYRDCVKALWGLIDTLFIHPYNTYCPFPCKCEEFLEDIIMSREGDPFPEVMFLIEGKFTPQEIKESARFIRKRFNPEWNSVVEESLASRV